MAHLGIIGAGTVGQAIARRAIKAGFRVTIASRRSAAELEALAAELGGAIAGEVAEAAALDLVVLAVRWAEIETVLSSLPHWKGRVLIDATNPFVRFDPPEFADLGGRSASTIVAALASGARVVKAFNSVTMANFDRGPTEGAARRMLFVSGDDADANAIVVRLIEAMGYAAIMLGDLDQGGLMQQAGGPLAGKDLLLAD